MGGDIGLGLHDLELGHAPGADQRLVHLQQGRGALEGFLHDHQLFLGAQQFAVGGDDLADGLRHGGLEVQAVGLLGQARQAQRCGGGIPAGAAHQRLDDRQVQAVAAVAAGAVGVVQLLCQAMLKRVPYSPSRLLLGARLALRALSWEPRVLR